MNWKTERIDRLFELGRGRVISEEEINKNLGIYPVFSSQTENDGCFGYVNFYEFEGEYITWTTDGANAGTVFYRNGRFNCTNVCGTLKPKDSNHISTKFFAYQIGREAFKHVAVVGNNKLMNNVMGRIKISYPINYLQQQKIAGILTKVDDAIQAVKNTIEKAGRLKKSLMQNLLTGKLKPDGTWRSDDEFYEDEKFGKVPVGWRFKKFAELGEFYGGSTPSTVEPKYWNGDICFLVPSDLSTLGENEIHLFDTKSKITSKGYNSCSSVLLKPETVCVSSRATIGDCIIAKVPICTNQGFINIVCNELLLNEYLVHWIRNNKKDILKYAAGTTFGEIGRRSFKNIRIALPEYHEQEKIADKIRHVLETIRLKQIKIQKLERLKKALMQNLLAGKVRIKLDHPEKNNME